MQLRPYQQQAIDAINRDLETHNSTLCVQPTGTGKTVQFATLAHEWPGRVLVLAHTRELIEQAADKIETITGEKPDIEMGSSRAGCGFYGHAKIVVASKDSLHERRLRRFDSSHFAYGIVDEAHRSARKNKTYKRVMDHFSCAKWVGFTATPDRRDKTSIVGSVYESVAFEYPIWHPEEPNAIDDGWLVPIEQRYVKVDGLSFSELKTVAGDFTDAELERVMAEETILHRVASPTVDIAGDRQTIVFCATIQHAELMASVIERYGRTAAAVSGKTDRAERAAIIEAFRRGRIQYLCGCDVFVEGFDVPQVGCVAICRPTKSRPRYTQMAGRGTRPLPGIVDGYDSPEMRRAAIAASAKPNVIILDYVGCSSDLKLTCSVADVLANAVDDEVTERAKELAEETPDAREAIRKAQQQVTEEEVDRLLATLEEQDRREDERRAQLTAQAQYHTRAIDPFGHDRSAWQGQKIASRTQATTKQINLLIALGVSPETARGYGVRQASAVIDSYKKRGVVADWSRLRHANAS